LLIQIIQGFESKPIIDSVVDPTTNAASYQAFRGPSVDILTWC